MTKKITNKDKKKAWDAFSKFIRVRDCLKTMGIPFVGMCVTCFRRFHIRYLEAGHFIPGRKNSVLFNEKGVNAQCKYCNEYKHGEAEKYEQVMVERYGREFVDQMKIDAKKIKHNNEMDFEEIYQRYTAKYEKLLRSHGYKTYYEMLRESK